MKNKLSSAIPDFLKPILYRFYYLPNDIAYLFKRRDKMLPPKSMMYIGSGDFEKIGLDFKRYFIELGDLQPNSWVLDVGCGVGRMAIPLTNYLLPEGRYSGFDIVKKGVLWCQNNIAKKYRNFDFQHSDVFNECYNPRGKIKAKDYKFPFGDGVFDLVFLTSVFTHMLELDMKNYLSEISRVLKPGGKCLITYFLLNKESEDLVQLGASRLDFRYEIEGCFTTNKRYPESAIAYKEVFVHQIFKDSELKIIPPIHYGNWCAREKYLSYQDIVVAEKNS